MYLAQSLCQKKNKKLDTLPRQNYACLLHTQMQPKLPCCPNVIPALKSSLHEDFEARLTFGWFGDVFLSMSVQKLAILADLISTFYKVGIVGS
jgi:hypothetical protein